MAGFKRRTTADDAGVMQQLVAQMPTPNDAGGAHEQAFSPVKAAPPPGAPVGTVITVSVDDLLDNPYNPRQIYSQASITEMAQSLAANDQDTPITGFYNEHGRLVLIDGHRRLRGAKQAGIKTLRLEVKAPPEGPRDWYLHARRMNTARKAQTPLDDALSWHLLLERKVFASQGEIAQALELSDAQVSKTLSLNLLPAAVRAAVIEIPELLAIKPLYEIYLHWKELGEPATMRMLAEAASVEGALSARDIERRRRSAPSATQPRPRSARRGFKVSGITGEIRRFEEQGRLELSIKGLTAEALADLEERIAAVVSATPELPLG